MTMASVTRQGRPGVIPWRAGLVLAAVAGMLSVALLAGGPGRAGDKSDTPPKGKLPADLERVPGNAVFFLSIRVGDLTASEMGKAVLQAGQKEKVDVLKEVEKVVGVSPAEIERLTLVLGHDGREDETMIVHTSKPYDRNKVREAVAPAAKEEKVKDATLYVTDSERALFFADDHTYLQGRSDVLRGLIENPAPVTSGPLSAALQQAAAKHLLVAGINPEPIIKEIADRELPPQAEPFKPLLKVRSALLVVDLGDELQGQARVEFGKPAEAKEGIAALKALQGLAQGALGQGIQQLGSGEENAKVVGLLEQFGVAVKGAKIEQADAAVTASASLKLEPSGTATALVKGVQKVREAARRIQSQNNLKQLVIAMHNYHDTYQTFPAQAVYDNKGKALLSWRVTLLPFLEQEALYKEFHLDEPWDSEHNMKLLERMPRVFANPADPPGKGKNTVYLGFVGKGAVFEGKKGIRITDIPDGTSNTIMFVEATPGVPWTKPEDLPYDPAKDLPKVGGVTPGGFNAGMCDGSVRFISNSINEKTLRLLIERNDGQPIPNDF
jgi:Protein of unknown function (DUF1559)